MPYISQKRRVDVFNLNLDVETAGELNYMFTEIALKYFNERRNYQAINDIIGALEACKLELYRRLVVPYENEKIKENGDIHTYRQLVRLDGSFNAGGKDV